MCKCKCEPITINIDSRASTLLDDIAAAFRAAEEYEAQANAEREKAKAYMSYYMPV